MELTPAGSLASGIEFRGGFAQFAPSRVAEPNPLNFPWIVYKA